jgi:hypothetical protein
MILERHHHGFGDFLDTIDLDVTMEDCSKVIIGK